MSRHLKSTLTSILAASMLAGVAFAQQTPGTKDTNRGPSLEEKQELVDPNSTGSISSDTMMSGDDMAGWQTGKINVVVVGDLNEENPSRTFLQDRMTANPDDVAALQASIQNNPALKSQLESQNVQINNIVAADKAADGSVTFYVQ